MLNDEHRAIHVTIPGSVDDPRSRPSPPPGVVVHRVPGLHPDDVAVHNGVPVTSVSRTLVDLAEELTQDELREAFRTARERDLLDMAAVESCYQRVEWRPSLAMLREVMDEFAPG